MRYNTTQHNLNFEDNTLAYNPDDVTGGEFFAGGGGWTEGADGVDGYKTIWILNHDYIAVKTNAFHHKGVKVYHADIYVQDEHELSLVDHVHGSLECNQHSGANAAQEKKLGSYTQGWEFYRYIKYLKPLLVSIENVPEFKKWSPTCEDGKPIKSEQGKELNAG